MAIQSKSLALAGIFLCISAAAHIFALIVAGFHVSTILFLAIGAAYFALGLDFLKGSDQWAGTALLVMILGMGGAYALARIGIAIPSWWLWLIIWADAAVAVLLALYLFRR